MVADGDSITSGDLAPTPYTSYLALNGAWNIINWGIPGETLATMLANAPANIDRLYVTGQKNVVVIWGGTNDFFFGTSVSTVYADMTSYVAARHAVGWKVIVPTMLSRAGEETQKNSYNALILANSAGADGIADFTGTPLGCDGCSTNATWFNSDKLHPTEAGVTTYEAPIIGAAINALP
jgi:hypothetical protein